MFVGSIVGFAGGKRCIPLGSHYTLRRRPITSGSCSGDPSGGSLRTQRSRTGQG
jgi:hypothetical protein